MPVKLGIRPEHLKLADGGDALLSGRVSLVESLGDATNVHVNVAGARDPVVARLAGQQPIRRGDAIRLAADRAAVHPFGADGRALRPGRSPA